MTRPFALIAQILFLLAGLAFAPPGESLLPSLEPAQSGFPQAVTPAPPLFLVPFTQVIQITAGSSHTCALTTDGKVYCWGYNRSGRLGDGTTTDRSLPAPVNALPDGVIAVEAGGSHTCALTADGKVYCWGDNYSGQLGDGTTTNRLTPVLVSGLPDGVTAISAGGRHTCALTASGAVYCWGSNSFGQVGDDTTTNRLTPVLIGGLPGDGISLSAGGYSTCALTASGRVYCWGNNNFGQLGDGSYVDRHVPTLAGALPEGVKAISAGLFHTCIITNGDGMMCWGRNEFGQLGDGTKDNFRAAPQMVNDLSSGVLAISTGTSHTCARTASGVKCWGFNMAGQVGDGTTTDRLIPADVAGPPGEVVSLSAGGYFNCAVTRNTEAYCWGENYYGQLGDGTLGYRTLPVQVMIAMEPFKTYLPNVLR